MAHRGCRRGGVIARLLTRVSSARIVRDPPVVAHGVLPRRGLDISSLRVVPAHTARRDPPSLLLSDEQRSARSGKKAKNKANRETRNMRSDDDLSHYGSGIGQKSKPTFMVSSLVGPATKMVKAVANAGCPCSCRSTQKSYNDPAVRTRQRARYGGANGASSRARRTLPDCVHRWTFARNRPENSHFFSLLGPPGVIPTCRDSIGKSFHAKQIGADTWPSRASKTPCGTSDPKFSYRFPLIVHYLKPLGTGSRASSHDVTAPHRNRKCGSSQEYGCSRLGCRPEAATSRQLAPIAPSTYRTSTPHPARTRIRPAGRRCGWRRGRRAGDGRR